MEDNTKIISNSAIFESYYKNCFVINTTQETDGKNDYLTSIGSSHIDSNYDWQEEKMISKLLKHESGFKIIGSIISKNLEKEKGIFPPNSLIADNRFCFVRSAISAITEEDFTYLVEYVYKSQKFNDRKELDSETIGNDLKLEIFNFRLAQVCKARNLSIDEIARHIISGQLNWKSYPAKLGMLHNHKRITLSEIDALNDIINRTILYCQNQNNPAMVKNLSQK